MAKFIFRLESVLKLKEEQKKQLELELARVQERKREADTELEFFVKKKIERLSIIHSSGKVQVMDYQVDYYYLDSLEKQIDNQKKKIDRILKVEQKVITELLKITKEKKIIEKLREKKKDLFDKEELRAENIFLDDISQRLKKTITAIG